MTNFVYANNVGTTLAAAATATMTTLTLASTTNLPATIPTGYVFPLTLNDAATRMIYEIVHVTAIAGTTLTVMRAQESTTAQNWSIGDYAFSAVTMGQMRSLQVSTPAVCSSCKVVMSVPAASYAAYLTADEIVTKSMLGAPAQILANFDQMINLATTGAGGMDTGAPPDSGFVAIYAIYNPLTGVSALLATNATTTMAPSVYAGGYMPSGFTESALVSVWPTSSTGQFIIGYQSGRTVYLEITQVLMTATQEDAYTALTISGAVPLNAKYVSYEGGISSTTATALTIIVAGSMTGIGRAHLGSNAVLSLNGPMLDIPVITPQTFYYMAYVATGTMSCGLYVVSYTI